MPDNTTDDHDGDTPQRPAGWPKPLADLPDQLRPPATPAQGTDDD